MSTFPHRRIGPDSDAFQAAGRLLVALTILLLIGSSLPAGTDVTPFSGHADRLSAETDQLRETLDSLSEALEGNESSQLKMAWEDLHSDLESVTSDVERARMSIDADGLVNRVESFRESFASVPGVSEKSDEWDQLTRLLSDLLGRTNT
jgi:hypothetical protein